MTDATSLVDERVKALLADLDPRSTDQAEFRGCQYDLGLAWVHFPEGFGGLGLPPVHQRQIDTALYQAGARGPGVRHFFGLTMAGPTIVTNGDDAIRGRLLRRGLPRAGRPGPRVSPTGARARPRRAAAP